MPGWLLRCSVRAQTPAKGDAISERYGVSERGVQQRPLASTLQELLRICEVLNHHHQPAARELAAAIWRLYCALSQLEQAPIAGTIGEKTT